MTSAWIQFLRVIPRRRRWAQLALLLAAMVLAQDPSRADDAASTQSRVKAAFVFNFIQFADWPEGTFAKPEDPIVIGVVDPDPLEGALATAVEGKSVKGRKLEIRHVSYPGSLGGCNVLYVGPQYESKAAEMIKSIGKSTTLTVGDPDNFTDAGGIIRFFLEEKKYRFEINVAAAERAHLQLSSKLLKLAKVVNK